MGRVRRRCLAAGQTRVGRARRPASADQAGSAGRWLEQLQTQGAYATNFVQGTELKAPLAVVEVIHKGSMSSPGGFWVTRVGNRFVNRFCLLLDQTKTNPGMVTMVCQRFVFKFIRPDKVQSTDLYAHDPPTWCEW